MLFLITEPASSKSTSKALANPDESMIGNKPLLSISSIRSARSLAEPNPDEADIDDDSSDKLLELFIKLFDLYKKHQDDNDWRLFNARATENNLDKRANFWRKRSNI